MPAPKDKKKFLLWAYPSTLELVKNNYRKDKCKSQSEFIERAIQYYVGHVIQTNCRSVSHCRKTKNSSPLKMLLYRKQ